MEVLRSLFSLAEVQLLPALVGCRILEVTMFDLDEVCTIAMSNLCDAVCRICKQRVRTCEEFLHQVVARAVNMVDCRRGIYTIIYSQQCAKVEAWASELSMLQWLIVVNDVSRVVRSLRMGLVNPY